MHTPPPNTAPEDRQSLAAWRFQSKTDELIPSVSSYIEACPDRYFITLTTKRRLDRY